MKKFIIWYCIGLFHVAMAQAADVTLIGVENPRIATGIVLGDMLERKLLIEAQPPYELPKSALPLKGERSNGIELVAVTLQNKTAAGGLQYELTLRYQVFASASQPRVMHLPAFMLTLAGGDAPVQLDVPAWHFWYSPLVAGNIHTARDNVQPQRKPMLLDSDWERLAVSLGILLLGVAGLVYINAEKRWLPWMGGHFSQACRKLRRIPVQNGRYVEALGYVHQAFNQVHGRALFRQQLGEFLSQHPQYRSLAGEIDDFFQRSDAQLFTRDGESSVSSIKELHQFCRRLRDCERRVA